MDASTEKDSHRLQAGLNASQLAHKGSWQILSGWKLAHLGRGAELLHVGGGVHQEGEEAQHHVDDDCVDVGAEEGGLEPTSHGVQDDTDGDKESRLHSQMHS